MLCSANLCCSVLLCAMLCYGYSVPCDTVSFCFVLRYAMLYCATLCYATPCYAILCYAVLKLPHTIYCAVRTGNLVPLLRPTHPRSLFRTTRAVREYQLATESIENAGTSPDPDALDKAMERFEKATAGMDRVGGWDAETFAQQARRSPPLLALPARWFEVYF